MGFGDFVAANIFCLPVPGRGAVASDKKIVPRCMEAMQSIRQWLQKLAEKLTAASVVYQADADQLSQFLQTVEYSRVSLIQQHEALAVILCSAIEKQHADVKDFTDLLELLKKTDKYDHILGE